MSGMLSRSSRTVGLLCACLGALGLSFKTIFIKAAYAYPVDAETLLALRMGYSLPFFVAMGVSLRREQRPLTQRDFGVLLLLGVLGYYAASYLDFLGLQYVSAALGRLILFLYPTLVVLLAAMFLRQPITGRMLTAMVLCYSGIALAIAHDARVGGANLALGCLFEFSSALSYALYLLISGHVMPRLGSTRVAAYATGMACVLAIGQFLLMRSPATLMALPWQVHALGLALAVISTVLPVWLVAESIRLLGVSQAALIATLGPVLTIALAAVVLGEPLGWVQVTGAALVIAGVWQVARRQA